MKRAMIALVLLASPAGAVVSLNNTNTATRQAGGAFSSAFSVNGGGTNTVCFAVVAWDGTAPGSPVATATFAGNTMTSAGTPAKATTINDLYTQIFYLVNPPTGSRTLAVNVTASPVEIYANVVSFNDVDTTTVVRAGSYQNTISSTVAGTTYSMVIVSSVSDRTISVIADDTGISGTNQTQDGFDNSGISELYHDHSTTPAASITDTWTFASGGASFAMVGFSILGSTSNSGGGGGGSGGGPAVLPTTPTVILGNQIQFTSTNTVTWSMYPGSLGTIDNNGLYTAASATFTARNVLGGCSPLPNDHVYYVDITSLPVDALSASRIANVGTSGHIDMTEAQMPINLMNNATPTDTMKFFYTTGSDGKKFPITPAPYRGVENALYPSDYFAQDRHQLGLNTDTCQFTEIYNYYPVGKATVPEGCPTCNAQSGVQYGPNSYQLADGGNGGGSIDAAGMYIEPLLPHYSEFKAGVIRHALRMTLSNGYNYSGFLWPGTNESPQCGNLSTCFPYGSRLRLKASYDDSALTPTQRVVTQALKHYGVFDADNGQSLHIQSASDVYADSVTYRDLDALRSVGPTFGDFEQVDESSLMVSSATGRVKLTNGFKVVPNDYAIVIATNTVDGSATYTYIALQTPTVGWKNAPFPANTAGMGAMSGTPQFQIPYFVNGATTTTVNCTMSPSIGSLTSDCKYTAPASGVVASSTTIITITPTGIATSTGAVSFPMTIFSSDAIRVNIGGKAGSISSPVIPYDAAGNLGPDSTGHFWASDPIGYVPDWYGLDDNSSPQASWPGSATDNIGLYYTQRHATYDGYWGANVPNGNYLLTLKWGNSDSNQILNSSITIDSQNIVLMTTATAVIPSFATFTPTDKTFAVQVTNGQFYFAIREVYNANTTMLGAWRLQFVSPLAQSSEQWRGVIHAQGKMSIR